MHVCDSLEFVSGMGSICGQESLENQPRKRGVQKTARDIEIMVDNENVSVC
jgi:hypothetical protein